MSVVNMLLREYGYFALVFILLTDAMGIPWPTEAALVLAGVAARAGHLNVAGVWLAAVSGAAVGSCVSYLLGRKMGPTLMQRIGGFFRLTPATMGKVDEWFNKHGDKAVFFGRLVPFVRNFTGYPAGVMGLQFPKYLLFSVAGYGLYIAFALVLGYGGLSIAKFIGDIERILYVGIPLALVVIWFKWGRKWIAKARGRG